MRLIARTLLAVVALLPIACSAAAPAPAYTEGKEYKRVREAVAIADKKRIQVEEFFWYGCGHCFAFEPMLEAWVAKKPADVDFVRVPNSLGRPVGLLHSRTFYAAESLNVLDKSHRALFGAIHEQQQTLDTDASIAAFFNRTTGVMPDVFVSTLNGFAVDSRVRRAEGLARSYGIASTPSLVIDGRYTVNATVSGGFAEMLKITDFLIAKIREERKKK